MTTVVNLVTRDKKNFIVHNGIITFNGINAKFIDNENREVTEIPVANLDFVSTEQIAGE